MKHRILFFLLILTGAAMSQTRLKIEPWDAIVEIDGREFFPDKGEAMIYLPDGPHYVTAYLQGFVTYEDTVVFSKDNRELDITLQHLQGFVSVKGDSETIGAAVYIDNENIGYMPIWKKQLVCGPHSVVIVKNGYTTYSERIFITNGKTTDIIPTMKAKGCPVHMVASPGVEIWFNGEMQGVEKWEGHLDEGTYTIITKKEAHTNGVSQITLTETESETVQVIKLPAPVPLYGSLRIDVVPIGSAVLIDDILVGATPLFKQLIPVGKHKIEVKATGMKSLTDSIEIKENITNNINGELKPAGNVRLTCDATDAKWYIDSVFCGNGGTISAFLTYGWHNISIETEDYKTYTGAFNTSKETVTVPFKLKPKEPEYLDIDIDGDTIRFIKIKGSESQEDFYISQTEVTQKLWKKIMGQDIFQQRNIAEKTGIFGDGDRYPMYFVSWNECVAFIKKLSKLCGKNISLPSVAEWTYVAKGGIYSLLEKETHPLFWSQENSDKTSHEVETSGMNVLGVCGLFGNVAEMCIDVYDKSHYTLRICKGGSWNTPASECNEKAWRRIDMSDRFNDVGFRLVIKP